MPPPPACTAVTVSSTSSTIKPSTASRRRRAVEILHQHKLGAAWRLANGEEHFDEGMIPSAFLDAPYMRKAENLTIESFQFDDVTHHKLREKKRVYGHRSLLCYIGTWSLDLHTAADSPGRRFYRWVNEYTVHELCEGQIQLAQTANVVGRERYLYTIVNIRPFGVVIELLRAQRAARHKGEGFVEVGKHEAAMYGPTQVAKFPMWEKTL